MKTPDIDPEEVRQALDIWREINGPRVAIRLAEEWLRLREQPAPDVRPRGYVECGKVVTTCVAAKDHLGPCVDSLVQPDVQAQIDAAVAREREAQSIDAASFRLLRDEADAADAWHAETGMKVDRPPRMSPATVKHIRDAEIRASQRRGGRARSGAKGE